MRALMFYVVWALIICFFGAANSFKLRPELLRKETPRDDEAIMAGFTKEGPGALDVDWWKEGQDELKNAMKPNLLNTAEAKNVILFVGDGMGPVTVSAARILHAQNRPALIGKDKLLSFENFPHVAVSRTYNVDTQVTDSAASGTALVSGYKTRQQLIGLNSKGRFADCNSTKDAEIPSILHHAIAKKKWTGVVTTTRVTHATPSAVYAHAASRWWESDYDQVKRNKLSKAERKKCPDIAQQLVDNHGLIRVIMGGGRQKFLPKNVTDPEYPTRKGERLDYRNLIKDWESKHKNGKYVWNLPEFNKVVPKDTDYLLGLFEPSHMKYDLDRKSGNEPSLANMTEKAIKILQRSKNGYFLLVEGGRIDHAHHDTEAKRALYDTVAMADAVQKAKELTNEKDTLIVVTSDHAHAFDFGGYPSLQNPILGFNDDDFNKKGGDQKPFTSLGYYNGPGYWYHLDLAAKNTPRKNLTSQEIFKDTYMQDTAIAINKSQGGETHGGEDVGIYASGPMAHLFHGSHEQSYIAHVMMYASCVGPNQRHCDTSRATSTQSTMLSAVFSVIFAMLIYRN